MSSGAIRLSALALAWLGLMAAGAPEARAQVNDHFANRMELAGDDVVASAVNLANATVEANEPLHPGSFGPVRSVWYAWSAPQTATYVIDTAGSGFDTVLAVYEGTAIDRLFRVTASDNLPGGNTRAKVTLTTTAGTTYAIAVARGTSATGTVALSIARVGPAIGPSYTGTDFFNDRPRITDDVFLGQAESSSTTARESGEPSHPAFTSRASHWFQWQAQKAGNVVIDLTGETVNGAVLDTALVVYSGSAINLLTRVAANDDAPGTRFSRVSFAVTPGQIYQIVVGSSTNTEGTLRLAVVLTPETGRIANLSVRTTVGADPQTLIAGFVLAGSGRRDLVLRGVGPGLVPFGVSNVLPDPVLEVRTGQTSFASNDDWGGSARLGDGFARVGAFPLPADSLDAAIAQPFAAGGYTAQAVDAAGGSGIALLEMYDAGGDDDTRLSNVSTRTFVGTGGGILIAGISIANGPRTVLIRAVGPGLTPFGVTGVLADPRVDVYSGTTLLAGNDDWSSALGETFSQVGAFALPNGSRDAALRITLQPGSYTAQVSGLGGTTGVALVEVYEVR